METRVYRDIGSFLVQTTEISLLVIGCIPLLVGLGCYILSVADGPEEEDEGHFCKGINYGEGKNTTPIVASYQGQYQEEIMMFERGVEPFVVGEIFNATTNPLIDPTQTAKATDPTNQKIPFITETSKKEDIKENTHLGITTVPFKSIEYIMSTLKYQGKPLSSHKV